jgi:TetR/AcrR family transcriptional regulator, transcriptional repressor for nem operon
MPGTRHFDESQVLDAMMRVFWQKGYEATTIDDLVQATGLKRGSLYHAFGDKAGMFCRTLGLYRQEVQAALIHALRGDDPQAALTRFFQLLAQAASRPGRPRGCMIDDLQRCCDRLPEAVAREAKAADAMETALFDLFVRAKNANSLAPEADCRALARFYAALARGVAGSEPEPIEDVARIGVGLLQAA